MGNGLRLRVNRNEGHKPKTKKENHIMKNRKNILTYIVAAVAILVTSASSSLGMRRSSPANLHWQAYARRVRLL